VKKIIITISLLLFNYTFAQHNIFIKAGSNVSWFLNAENSKPKIGYSFCIEKGFKLFKGIFLDVGIGYTTRGAVLENRTIQPYNPPSTYTDAFYWDIQGNIGYVDLPILLKYNYRINTKLSFNPIVGMTIAIPTNDYSTIKQKKFYKIKDARIHDYYDYDYHFEQEEGFGNNKVRYICDFGFSVNYSQFSINLLYSFDNTQEYSFDRVDTIKYNMNSMTIYFAYQF